MASRDESFKDFVLDQLQDLDGVDAWRMFGGYGLYRDETFFGILHRGSCILKLMDLRLANIASEK
jgi:DNA transformation protein and related proteins